MMTEVSAMVVQASSENMVSRLFFIPYTRINVRYSLQIRDFQVHLIFRFKTTF
jgi:hypothetical protein